MLLSFVVDFLSPFLLNPLIELKSAPLPGSLDVDGGGTADADGATGGGGGGGAGAVGCFCFLFDSWGGAISENKLHIK